jgi:L-iditol 2-dehydrogenase
MKAIQFNFSLPRYALGLALRKVAPSLLWSGVSCTSLAEVADPLLPGEDWAVVKTGLGGICGTDTATIHLETSTYYEPFTSFPFVFGHENAGEIAETGSKMDGWKPGERVVVEPVLWCAPRGFERLCRPCSEGMINLCERKMEGDLAPGFITGACRDTGGSWGPYFVAHRSQLYRVPDALSNENVMMIEPLAVSLHAVLQNMPKDGDRVLIIGAGSIGLCTLAALRGLGSQAEVIMLARHAFQAEAAEKLGASRVVRADKERSYYDQIAELSGGSVRKPTIGNRVVNGGAEVCFECVGSEKSLDDALRLTRNGGRTVLVGIPGITKNVDWTVVAAQELQVRAAFAYHHAEQFGGKTWRTFDLAIELLESKKIDLSWLVTHKFRLEEYGRAFELLEKRGSNRAIKAAFEFG